MSMASYNKAIKNRPQKTWAGLANARLLLQRYVSQGLPGWGGNTNDLVNGFRPKYSTRQLVDYMIERHSESDI